MQSLRDFLPSGFCEQMEKELGREDALRLLWPAIVGSALAAQAKPLALRGDTLVIGVPEKGWISSVASFEQQILEASARFWRKPLATRIEFVCIDQTKPQAHLPASKAPIRDSRLE